MPEAFKGHNACSTLIDEDFIRFYARYSTSVGSFESNYSESMDLYVSERLFISPAESPILIPPTRSLSISPVRAPSNLKLLYIVEGSRNVGKSITLN